RSPASGQGATLRPDRRPPGRAAPRPCPRRRPSLAGRRPRPPPLSSPSSRHDGIRPLSASPEPIHRAAGGSEAEPAPQSRCWIGVRALLLAFLGLTLAACDATPGETDRAFQASGEIIAMSGGAGGAGNACFMCHGLKGEGDGVSSPRLAGLDQGYLQKQMEDYASGLRPDDVMTRVARGLDPEARRLVA